MPHQCLKCGKVFPSGSPEILKGCSDCGGKRFFYTEEPVSNDERERLIEQANKDIKVLIHEILAQSKSKDLKFFDSEGEPVSAKQAEGKADWVKITPSSGEEVEQVPVTGEAGHEDKIEPEHEHKMPTVKQILQQLKGKTEIDLGAKKPEIGKEKPEEEEPAAEVELEEKKGIGKVKQKLKPGVKVKKRRRRPRPEIITVKEPGVYDIQLDKLMRGFPIIINKDGTYLVHLPSVFESIERGNK